LTYINRLGFGVAASDIKRDLSLSDEQMGYLASAFLVAYGLFQIPGGLLGDRFGGRNLLTVVVLAWSLLSGATALAPYLFRSVTSVFLFLLALRFLFGIFQAAEFPSLARVVADWVPVRERASAQGTIWMFSRLGGAVVPFLFTGMFWLFGTWTIPFGIMAGLGVMWCAGFWLWFRNTPEQMRGVNHAEQELSASDRPGRRGRVKLRVFSMPVGRPPGTARFRGPGHDRAAAWLRPGHEPRSRACAAARSGPASAPGPAAGAR
jgi:MFS family permease